MMVRIPFTPGSCPLSLLVRGWFFFSCPRFQIFLERKLLQLLRVCGNVALQHKGVPMTIDVSNSATSPSQTNPSPLGIDEQQWSYVDVLQSPANRKDRADCTIGMTTEYLTPEIKEGIQTVGLDEDFVRASSVQPRRSRNHNGTAVGGLAVVDHACIDCRDTRGMDTHLRVSRHRGRGHRDYPRLQSAHRYAGRHTNKLRGV